MLDRIDTVKNINKNQNDPGTTLNISLELNLKNNAVNIWYSEKLFLSKINIKR